MSLFTLMIIILAIGSVAGGVLLLKQSAKKFNLTDEQLAEIKKRNEAIEKEEQKEE